MIVPERVKETARALAPVNAPEDVALLVTHLVSNNVLAVVVRLVQVLAVKLAPVGADHSVEVAVGADVRDLAQALARQIVHQLAKGSAYMIAWGLVIDHVPVLVREHVAGVVAMAV